MYSIIESSLNKMGCKFHLLLRIWLLSIVLYHQRTDFDIYFHLIGLNRTVYYFQKKTEHSFVRIVSYRHLILFRFSKVWIFTMLFICNGRASHNSTKWRISDNISQYHCIWMLFSLWCIVRCHKIQFSCEGQL